MRDQSVNVMKINQTVGSVICQMLDGGLSEVEAPVEGVLGVRAYAKRTAGGGFQVEVRSVGEEIGRMEANKIPQQAQAQIGNGCLPASSETVRDLEESENAMEEFIDEFLRLRSHEENQNPEVEIRVGTGDPADFDLPVSRGQFSFIETEFDSLGPIGLIQSLSDVAPIISREIMKVFLSNEKFNRAMNVNAREFKGFNKRDQIIFSLGVGAAVSAIQNQLEL